MIYFCFWELLILNTSPSVPYFWISYWPRYIFFKLVLRITASRSLKCGLDILGFPRIIYNVRKLSEPKKIYPASRVFLSCRFHFLVFSWLSLLLLFSFTVAATTAMKRLGNRSGKIKKTAASRVKKNRNLIRKLNEPESQSTHKKEAR